MPLTLEQQTILVGNTKFQFRVAMGMYTIAREYLADNEANILEDIFARSVIQSNYTDFLKYAALVVADPLVSSASITTPDSVSDQTILQAIRNMWYYLSGVDTGAQGM